MQLNICEDEGGGMGLRPGCEARCGEPHRGATSARRLGRCPGPHSPFAISTHEGFLYVGPQTLSRRSWSILKVKKEQHQSPESYVLGKSISGISRLSSKETENLTTWKTGQRDTEPAHYTPRHCTFPQNLPQTPP